MTQLCCIFYVTNNFMPVHFLNIFPMLLPGPSMPPLMLPIGSCHWPFKELARLGLICAVLRSQTWPEARYRWFWLGCCCATENCLVVSCQVALFGFDCCRIQTTRCGRWICLLSHLSGSKLAPAVCGHVVRSQTNSSEKNTWLQPLDNYLIVVLCVVVVCWCVGVLLWSEGGRREEEDEEDKQEVTH
jgi:hypothetical protein